MTVVHRLDADSLSLRYMRLLSSLRELERLNNFRKVCLPQVTLGFAVRNRNLVNTVIILDLVYSHVRWWAIVHASGVCCQQCTNAVDANDLDWLPGQ